MTDHVLLYGTIGVIVAVAWHFRRAALAAVREFKAGLREMEDRLK